MNNYTIKDITRASGGFAMLAVDQREAMRLMFAAAGAKSPVSDSVLTDFKVNAAKILSPYASAILVDQQFCYRRGGAKRGSQKLRHDCCRRCVYSGQRHSC